jgi:hypothetical protein
MLFVAEPYRPLFQTLGLESFEAVSRFFLGPGPTGTETDRVVVRPARVTAGTGSPADLDVYFKEYQYPRPAWKFLGRRSKARCEFDNYQIFSRLNLGAAEALAVGEDRDALGRLRKAFILTRAIPSAQTLIEFMKGPARDRSQPAVRALRYAVLQQLARMARRIHDAQFFHHDLVWRNILVTVAPDGTPRLWWIDCPRGSFVRWAAKQHRRRLKDLASLDKPAGQWCTRAERARFIRDYLGVPRLDRAGKKLIREILDYRKRRWPEDWDGH